MRRYQEFTLDGKQVPHTTIKGIKLAIRRKKLSDGKYVGLTPCGNIHTWEVKSTSYVLKGKRTASKSTVGKGVNVLNTVAKLIKVEKV